MARSAYILTFNQLLIYNVINFSHFRPFSNSQQSKKFMYARESERRMKIYVTLFKGFPAINLDREQRYEHNYIIRSSKEAELNLPSLKKNSS